MFLYTNNEISGKINERKNPFEIATTPTTKKYLAINLTKDVKDTYTEDYKTLVREIEDKQNGKVVCIHGLKESL